MRPCGLLIVLASHSSLLKSPALLLAFALLSLTAVADNPARSLRVYFLGNSVTDTIRYEPFAKLAASRGHELIWGRHMIPGAPLHWLWDHPSEGFKHDAFGYPREALTNTHGTCSRCSPSIASSRARTAATT